MKNKIILTSIISMLVAMPAFAEFTAGQQIADENGLLNGMACDENTLGVTQDTANLEAIWTPNTYNITYTCADGTPSIVAAEMSMVDCDADPTNDECISEIYAIYGKRFLFAGRGCFSEGYHQTGWSCTRDSVQNDTATVYTLGQQLQAWNIDSDLTCTEIREGNTITLDWYNMGQKQTVSSAASECTYGEANSLTLPSNPSARPGYTFGGWRVFDVCSTLNTQGTCNMNASCFWYGTQAGGTCVNINNNGCDAAADSTACENVGGYCRYFKGHCLLEDSTIYDSFDTSQQCSAHNGIWDDMDESCSPNDLLGGGGMLDQGGTSGDLSLLG